MSGRPAVEVLLATCNGQRFLREQIDSILAQDYANVRISARDDGSSDRTPEILREYAERFPDRLQVMPPGPATGSARDNFLLLMRGSKADYICFSDQDDVWLPDKISITMKAMEELERRWGRSTPLLVFTDLRVVDEHLQTLHESFWAHMHIDPDRISRLAELLGKSVVSGCTAVLNRPLLELSLRMPKEAFMHDRWVALLASLLGKSAIVRNRTVLYRQHDRNVLGAAPDQGRRSLIGRLLNFPASAETQIVLWKLFQQEARALLSLHGAEFAPGKRELLKAYLRCETSQSRFIRVSTFLRYRFFFVGRQQNLATLLHLWNLKRKAG